MRVLLIDNYDSFVHNLARHFRLLGCETTVVRNDQIDTGAVRAMQPSAIVFSPGPCTPDVAGASLEIARAFCFNTPMLGVCLGHQTIAAAFGAKVVRASTPWHGRASLVQHDGQGVFRGVPNPLRVGRYHSLVVDPETLPTDLSRAGWGEQGELMAFQHTSLPVVGLQFHPESILTQEGLQLLHNFLEMAHPGAPTAPGAGAPR